MKFDITCIITMVILFYVLFIFGYVVIEIVYENEASDQACVDINMIEADYPSTIFEDGYCIDNKNIAYETVFKCKGFAWNKECTANLVSVK